MSEKPTPVDLWKIPRKELALQEIDTATFLAVSHWRWVMESH